MPLNSNQKIEITHDILAREVYARLDATEKMRLKITQFMRDRYDYFLETKTLLDKKDLEYIDPYLTRVNLSAEQNDFVEKSRKDVSVKERKRQQRNLAIGTVLALAAVIATFFGIQASHAAADAEAAAELAIASEAKAQESAEREKTTANEIKEVNATLKAQQETLNETLVISEQRRAESERSRSLAQIKEQEAKAQARRADSLGQVALRNVETLEILAENVKNLVLEKNGFNQSGDAKGETHLPYLVLFFDDDRPRRGSGNPNIANQSYLETLESYKARFNQYLAQFSSDSDEDFIQRIKLEQFFQNEVFRISEASLATFVQTAEEFQKLNIPILVEAVGCASPKYNSNPSGNIYNSMLINRRVNSVERELIKMGLSSEKWGDLYQFVQVVDRACNTSTRNPSVSLEDLQDIRDRKFSVFSIDAARARRVELTMRIGRF